VTQRCGRAFTHQTSPSWWSKSPWTACSPPPATRAASPSASPGQALPPRQDARRGRHPRLAPCAALARPLSFAPTSKSGRDAGAGVPERAQDGAAAAATHRRPGVFRRSVSERLGRGRRVLGHSGLRLRGDLRDELHVLVVHRLLQHEVRAVQERDVLLSLRRTARRLLPLAAMLACSGVASATASAVAVGCSATPAYAYGSTYGSNCGCQSCTVWCATPHGPYTNGTCC
jgi:hypothetical protein